MTDPHHLSVQIVLQNMARLHLQEVYDPRICMVGLGRPRYLRWKVRDLCGRASNEVTHRHSIITPPSFHHQCKPHSLSSCRAALTRLPVMLHISPLGRDRLRRPNSIVRREPATLPKGPSRFLSSGTGDRRQTSSIPKYVIGRPVHPRSPPGSSHGYDSPPHTLIRG